MKKILILSLFIAGCNTTQPNLITTKHDIFLIPEEFYNCPIAKIPASEKLTDIDVSNLIVTLYKNNRTCKISLEGIKKYIDQRNGIISEPNKETSENK